jgi:ribonuclease P protein subunit POP4
MTIAAENVLHHELIGLYARIADASDSTLCGVSGMIVSESRNMFMIENKNGRMIRIAKKVATTIALEVDSGVCFISGSSLIGKPEDRLARLN